MTSTPASKPGAPHGLSGFQKGVIVLLVLVLVGSVVARAMLTPETPAGGAGPYGAQAFGAGGSAAASAPQGLERWLPYLTEGSLFGLVGFALGYTTKKVAKFALIAIALVFLGVQALVWAGATEVDWGGLVHKLNAWIFNLKQNEPLTQFVTRHVPAAGSLGAGWLVGFRRG